MLAFKEIKEPDELAEMIKISFENGIKQNEEHPFSLNQKFITPLKYPAYIANAGNETVGIAFFSPFHSKGAYAGTCNLNIYVKKNYRKQGIGIQLWTLLMDSYLLKNTISRIVASVFTEQADTIAWLEKRKFVKIGKIEKVDFQYCLNKDVIFMLYKKENK